MRVLITVLACLLPMAIIVALQRESCGFHNGGVGACDGCHTMHNSQEGQPVVRASGRGAYRYLLMGQDAGSVCLNCHEQSGDTGPTSYHISTPLGEMASLPPKQLTPGGDFGWLRKSYTWVPGAGEPQEWSYGERHGHNVIAADFMYDPDATYSSAPGGSYPSDRLTCISCHDPHGKYRRNADGTVATSGRSITSSGSFANSPNPGMNTSVGVYRMLGGKNYQPASLTGNYAFVNDPPAAVAPDPANRPETDTQTRVAYGSGMSEWCRNCHGAIHDALAGNPGPSNFIHGSGMGSRLGQTYADQYNKYVKTGDLSGASGTSYWSLTPFEEGTADYAILKLHAKTDDSYLTGPDTTTAQVMCLSCHRAHASGWDGIMRWKYRDHTTDFIVFNGYYVGRDPGYPQYQPYSQGRSELDTTRAYYNRTESKYAPNQDTLCNKCHVGVYP